MANKALRIIIIVRSTEYLFFSWLSQLSMIHHDQKSKKREHQHWMMKKPPQQKNISRHPETIQSTENREEFARIQDQVRSTIWQFAPFIQKLPSVGFPYYHITWMICWVSKWRSCLWYNSSSQKRRGNFSILWQSLHAEWIADTFSHPNNSAASPHGCWITSG